MRSALNSSAVWELTTEGERLFHCGIIPGKKSSSGHHCMSALSGIILQYWSGELKRGA